MNVNDGDDLRATLRLPDDEDEVQEPALNKSRRNPERQRKAIERYGV